MTSEHRPTAFQPVQSLPPAEPERPPWALAVGAVVAVLVVGLAVGALLFRGGGGNSASPSPTTVAGATASPAPTSSPTATLSPSPTTTVEATATASPDASPTGSPAGSPTGSPDGSPGASPERTTPPDIAALIDDVVRQVPPIRELEPLRDVPYRMVTRDEFRDELLRLLEEETDPEQLAAEERLLKRMGLLPDEMDLQDLLLDLYGAGVAAYYQPENRTFYVIERDAPFGPLDRMYVAHEYTHALQDQHYDLAGTRITDPSQGDAVLGQLAAIEGDASWLMVLWAQEHLTLEELFELLNEELAPADEEVLENMPPILTRQLTFPYNEGLTFVSAIHQDGGWEPVNQLLVEPPRSTEQVLHPEKYAAGEEPIAVEIPDLSGALGDGWARTYEQTFGELSTHIWLVADETPDETMPGLPVDYPYTEEAAGWGGDRLAMYEDGNDGWAVVWDLAWDSDTDADEFLARARELEGTLDGVVDISENDGLESGVRILLANDEITLDSLREALGP